MRLKTLSKYRPLCGYKAVARGLALFAFWCAGMMVWYKFFLEGVR